jgi:predicted small metal-binding protein
MAMTLACKDTGTACDYVACGETMEELNAKIAKHAKEVHGYTDEQLSDPKMIEMIKSLVKED